MNSLFVAALYYFEVFSFSHRSRFVEFSITRTPPHELKIFTLFEYARHNVPGYVRLNLETWRARLTVPKEDGTCCAVKPRIIGIDDKNVRKWIPDIVDEYVI